MVEWLKEALGGMGGEGMTEGLRAYLERSFDAVYSGVKSAAVKSGDTVNEIAPSSASATGQIPFIQNAINQHVDGLMISIAPRS